MPVRERLYFPGRREHPAQTASVMFAGRRLSTQPRVALPKQIGQKAKPLRA